MNAAERYAAAWTDRRRRMVIFKATQWAFFALLLIALLVNCSIYPNLSHRFMLCFPLWFLGYMAAGVWLNRFRCPRCRKLYYWRLELKEYMTRCRHCGLPEDTTPSLDSECSN